MPGLFEHDVAHAPPSSLRPQFTRENKQSKATYGNGTVVLLSRVIFRSSLTPATPHVPISEGTRTRVVRCDLTVHNVSVFCYVRVLFVFFCVFSCVVVSALFFFVLFRFCGSFLVA